MEALRVFSLDDGHPPSLRCWFFVRSCFVCQHTFLDMQPKAQDRPERLRPSFSGEEVDRTVSHCLGLL